MSTRVGQVAAGTAAAILLAAPGFAQGVPEVQVQATRAMSTKTTNRMANGVPIVDISVSYGVSTKDLDLATNSGAKELEQRVKDAAAAACKEITRQYPEATPSEAECTANAAGKAMSQVHQLVTAAEKNKATAR